MGHRTGVFFAICIGGLAPVVVEAQVTGSPPNINIIYWEVIRDGVPSQVVYDRGAGIGSLFAISTFEHLERDVIFCDLDMSDPDWVSQITFDPAGNPQNDNEEVFLRIQVFGNQFIAPPSPPPLSAAFPFPSEDFLGPEGDDDPGYKPTVPQIPPPPWHLRVPVTLQLPEFLGKNQRRLRGQIPFDVQYELVFQVSNELTPDEATLDNFDNSNIDSIAVVNIGVLDNPAILIPNPPPFADAGSDKTVVVNTLTQLDASRTFDAFNDGFDSDDLNVLDKDTLNFTWEMLSGPAPVTINQSTPNDPTADVTLAVPGIYIFRVLVDDDRAASLPSADTVTLTAVETLPDANPPVPLAAHPANSVSVGAIITLDGSQSYDPDGDAETAALTFRWKQTNALGDPLEVQDLLTAFQPLSGVDAKISTWQAIAPGTYYFRLLVSDGIFLVPTDLFSVQVVANQTSGRTETAVTGNTGSTAPPADESSIAAAVPPLCGAGLLPLAAMPLVLRLIRRRR